VALLRAGAFSIWRVLAWPNRQTDFRLPSYALAKEPECIYHILGREEWEVVCFMLASLSGLRAQCYHGGSMVALKCALASITWKGLREAGNFDETRLESIRGQGPFVEAY